MDMSTLIKKLTIRINLVTIYKLVRRFIWKRKSHVFGLIPDKDDNRDFIYMAKRLKLDLPATTDKVNIKAFPWRYNQGSLGSCVGHGDVEAFRRVLQVTGKPDFAPSPLFAYWIARDNKYEDTGASIRDSFKAMNTYGLCSESKWPYITRNFDVTPPQYVFEEAEKHQTIRYERIYPVSKEAIMDAVSQGFPVVYGKSLYSSFMSERVASTGKVPKPNTCRESFLGGHCMVIFDYDEEGTIELNSWGSSWGDGGVCHVPWDYVLDGKLCRDFWVIFLTE